jgi:DNA adenine methylase
MQPKPIIKWVGGKTQIIDKLLSYFPEVINNYHEPFLGGGSVLFALLSYVKDGRITLHGNVYAYDINEPLIYMYKNIQSHHHAFYSEIRGIIDEFYECASASASESSRASSSRTEKSRVPLTKSEAKTSRESYYYWIRSEYNKLTDKTTLSASAMFLFLNKTCFRGLFRMGPNGFNVPYGHYQNPEIINWTHLEEIHELIQPVRFECCDFRDSLSRVGLCDFVYLDPPYVPEKATSFVGYTENGFSLEQHEELFRCIHELPGKGIRFVLSNADVPLVRESFASDVYMIMPMLCKRAINSKNPSAKAGEILIRGTYASATLAP